MMGSLASLCLGAVIVGMGLSVVLWVDIAVERQCWEELGGYTWMGRTLPHSHKSEEIDDLSE